MTTKQEKSGVSSAGGATTRSAGSKTTQKSLKQPQPTSESTEPSAYDLLLYSLAMGTPLIPVFGGKPVVKSDEKRLNCPACGELMEPGIEAQHLTFDCPHTDIKRVK